MRRRVQWPDIPPPMLQRFDPAEWPADEDLAAFNLWRQARKGFAEIHGWPGGFVALLQGHQTEWMRRLGGPD